MIRYPQIDPVAFSLGPLQVHWYGLMYLIGFGGAFFLLSMRAGRPGSGWTREQVSDLIFYGAIGAVLGGRLGYVFFYNFDRFMADPAWLLRVWEGGMSFHGGLLGVLLAIGLFGRKYGKSFLDIGDFGAPAVPIGLGAGRLGNFIGAELWGRSSDVSWAMVFPTDPQRLPRHPSQLYQFALEGVVMFLVLWWVSRKPRRRGVISGLFLVLYGSFRILVEFFREPDAQLGFIALGWVTMGQLLSLPMVALGVVLMIYGWRLGSATSKAPGS